MHKSLVFSGLACRVDIKPSKNLLAFFILLHLIPLLAVMSSIIPVIIKLLLAGLVSLSFIRVYQLYFLQTTADSVKTLLFVDGIWHCFGSDGRDYTVELQPWSLIHRKFLILGFKTSDAAKQFNLLLDHQSIAEKNHHQLRIICKLLLNSSNN